MIWFERLILQLSSPSKPLLKYKDWRFCIVKMFVISPDQTVNLRWQSNIIIYLFQVWKCRIDIWLPLDESKAAWCLFYTWFFCYVWPFPALLLFLNESNSQVGYYFVGITIINSQVHCNKLILIEVWI